MRPYRPSAVLVVAILQLCFGAFALCLYACGGGLQLAGGGAVFMPAGSPQAAQQQQLQREMEDLMEQKIPHYKAWQYFQLAISVTAATVMVVSGAGLLKMRPWARRLTIVYAGYNIISTIIAVIIAVAITLPVTAEVMEELTAQGKFPPQALATVNAMGPMMKVMVFGQLVLLAYPIVLLVIMFLPDVRKAFRRQSEKPVEDDAGEEWPDDEPGTAPDEGIQRPGDIKSEDS